MPKKSKRSRVCLALEYKDADVIRIAKNSIGNPSAYRELLKDLSDDYNTDCLEFARDLTALAKQTAAEARKKMDEDLRDIKYGKKKSSKVSPKATTYGSLPKKSKRSRVCRALMYTNDDVIEIAKNSITNPDAYRELIENLSDYYNTDCLEFARDLTELAKKTAEILLPIIEYRYFDSECDERQIHSFSDIAEVAQLGSTKMGSKCFTLTSRTILGGIPISGEIPIAIITYSKTDNQVEIGKAWSNRVENFEISMNYFYQLHSSSTIYISCASFSEFQLRFWSVQMGFARPYIIGNVLYLLKEQSSLHDLNSLIFIKNCILRYEKITDYTIPTRVLRYLHDRYLELNPLGRISSLVLTNNEFNCKPVELNMDSALNDSSSSAAFIVVPSGFNQWKTHAFFNELFKFLTTRLDFHFIGSITREGVYMYRFRPNIRLLLEYLLYRNLLKGFGELLEQSSIRFLELNYFYSNPNEAVKVINEITLRAMLSGSNFESYVENLTNLDQPILEANLLPYNADIVFKSFLN